MTNTLSTTKKLTYSAIFMAIGLLLPFLTGQIPQIGSLLSPMHIPVLICGIVCGGLYGGIVGFILPILRSFIFGMPVLMPMAIAMAFELAAYGIVIGVFYKLFANKKCKVYASLIIAMVLGRVVFGVAMSLLMLSMGGMYTLGIFISSSVIGGIPGIILHLILVPTVILVLQKAGVMADENIVSTTENSAV